MAIGYDAAKLMGRLTAKQEELNGLPKVRLRPEAAKVPRHRGGKMRQL
jgi:hypothetical protein